MKILRWSILLAVIVGVLAAAFLVGTEQGVRLLHRGLTRYASSFLQIERMEGRLFNHLNLHGVQLTTDGVEVRMTQLEVHWSPLHLARGVLQVNELSGDKLVVITRDTAGNTTDDGEAATDLPYFAPLLGVAIDRLDIDGLRFVDSNMEEILSFDKLAFSGAGRAGLFSIRELMLDGPEMGCTLHGSIDTRRHWSLDLLGTWHIAGYGFHPANGTFSVDGNLPDPLVHVGVNAPASIRVSGGFHDLLTTPGWQAELEATNVDLAALIEDCPQIILDRVSGSLVGDFGHYRGRVTADGAWQGLDQLHLVTDIDGDGYGIRFPSLTVTRRDGVARAPGAMISWRTYFDWQGDFTARNFDMATLDLGLSGLLGGKFHSRGEVFEDGSVEVVFEIDKIQGDLQDYPFAASGQVVLTDLGVQTSGLVISNTLVDGQAYVEQARFLWEPELRWSVEARMDQFQLADLHPILAGDISGRLHSEGTFPAALPKGFLQLSSISGNLNGHPLSGGGELRFDGADFSSPGVRLSSGTARLDVAGRAGKQLGLDFSLLFDDLGSLIDGGQGSGQINGQLLGSWTTPELVLEMSGKGLGYEDFFIDTSQLKVRGELAATGGLDVSTVITGGTYGQLAIDEAEVRVSGNIMHHNFRVQSSGSFGELALNGDGGYEKMWRGRIENLQLKHPIFGPWRQRGATEIVVNGLRLSLEDFLFGDEQAELTMEGAVDLSDEIFWTAKVTGRELPMELLRRSQLTDLPVDGRVEGTVQLTGNGRAFVQGQLQMAAAEVAIEVPGEGEEPVGFVLQGSHLDASLEDESLSIRFGTALEDKGEANLTASITGIGAFDGLTQSLTKSPLSARIELTNFNMGMFSALTGYWVQPSGRLQAVFAVQGTPVAPRIEGRGFIDKGGLTLPYQGVFLDDIQLRMEARNSRIEVFGQASSGPGKITAEGQIEFDRATIAGQLRVAGENFLLVDLPEYRFRVDPSLDVVFDKDSAKISGRIKVPHGLIAPEELQGAVTASDDVEFVDETGVAQSDVWPLVLDVHVVLGDDIRIDGYGVKGAIDGELEVKTTPAGLLSGKGELDLVDGVFTIYGRTLDIERGRVLFTGGPIDNPGVDIRAQKVVSDEKAKGKGYTVGVDISGLVQDLQFDLFSEPYMEDTDILSHMIVGHSLADSSSEEGNLLLAAAESLGMSGGSRVVQSIGGLLALDDLHIEGSSKDEDMSLVVGKKITEDLYIGYDVNMFSQLGQFRVRYDLVHGFRVETRSSSESTGADLLYSFER